LLKPDSILLVTSTLTAWWSLSKREAGVCRANRVRL